MIGNSSRLVGTEYNQTYFTYLLKGVNGTGSVAFDNFRIRKYGVVEPTFVFGDTFVYGSGFVQRGVDLGGFLSATGEPLGDWIFSVGVAVALLSLVSGLAFFIKGRISG